MKLPFNLIRPETLARLSRAVPVAKLLGFTSVIAALLTVFAPVALAQPTVSLAQIPLLALKSAPGLVMLTMSRDHRLYYAAYNDTSDLNGDGVIDVGFKPNLTYFGYFVSDRCYKYDTAASPARFVPVAIASAADGCASVATARWHGNWMNWMATSRMDALRKVLYGGQRVTDTGTDTVLQAAHIPPDSHIWGKEFRPAPVGTDTYLIQNYTPMSAPAANKMHIFMIKSEGSLSSVYTNLSPPSLRAIANVDIIIDRVWLWASSERPVGGLAGVSSYTRPAGSVTNPSPITVIPYGLPGYSSGTAYSSQTFPAFITPPEIRVETCVPISLVREAGCTGYPLSATSPTSWKPTGVLHDYSANDSLKFGLLTGSYLNNYSGGVLRKDIVSFSDEVNNTTDGTFKSLVGIVKTIDRLTNYGFNVDPAVSGNNDSQYACGFNFLSLRQQGQCHMWGSPVGEMMYEGLRYFTDKSPTSAFVTGVNGGSSPDKLLTLPTKTSWLNPFRPKGSGGSPICSRPVQMVIADPITSFDSDQLPGAAYTPTTGYGASITGDIPGLNVSTEADDIWNKEFGTSASRSFFAGQSSATNADGNPTAKPATSFKFIRGHAPDETASQGSYYSASVAKFGRETGVSVRTGSSATPVNVKVDTISVALGSVVPKLEFAYAGKTVSLVPFSKSVTGTGFCNAPASPKSVPLGYQPTGLITGLFIDRIANTPVANAEPSVNSGRPFARFMVSFSDGDQGGDNEADVNVYYTMSINALGGLVIRLDSYYQATCSQQNIGYVISGTTKDGVYLEVQGVNSSPDEVYYLDTRPGQNPTPAAGRFPANTTPISKSTATRAFDFSSGPAGGGFIPHDPLWYAAKYGGAGVIDANGDPTNYFKVTNPSNLPAQMAKAFRSAAALAAVASTSVVGVQRSSGSAAVYQTNYDSLTWSSRIYAFGILPTGAVANTQVWESSALVPAPATRNYLFLGRGGTNTPFALTSGNFASLSALGTPSEQTDFGDADTYEFILGNKTKEERKGGSSATFRNRGTTAGADFGSVVGDIVNSDPQVVAKRDYGYTAGDGTYATYLTSLTKESLAVGANDGFFHIFDGTATSAGGAEVFGFMPQAARRNIKDLAKTDYAHRYFVDGSIGQGHAKIRVPGDPTAAWRTVLLGTGGAGAKTIFAINAPNSQVYSANSVLWEINENTTLPITGSLGNIMGRPAIGKLKNGTWVAVFGNGYNSTSGEASLLVVNLETGAVIKQITTASIGGNGLGDTEIVNSTSGTMDTIEYVYAADFKGNIWRFDISASSVASWSASGALLYKTPSGRPITGEIKVGAAVGGALPSGGKMIYFGTGSYLNLADTTATSPNQALYGIYDDLQHNLTATPGVVETNLDVMTINMPSAASDKRTTSTPTTPWFNTTGKKGWVLPLAGTNVAAGERAIAPPVRFTVPGVVDAMFFTSLVPGTDECKASIDTWITGVDAMTGGYAKPFAGDPENSLKVVGGSPRGVFVLDDGPSPTLYISQTIFDNTINTTTYSTTTGGATSASINGVIGRTQILGMALRTPPAPPPPGSSGSSGGAKRQIWRQLK